MKKLLQNMHNGGETLVETIVSFAVVMVMMVTITAVVQLSIRLNNRAAEKAAALEEDCTALENSAYTGDTEPSVMQITLPNGEQLSLDVELHEAGMLHSFTALPKEDGA